MKLLVGYFPEYICWLDSFTLTRTPSGFFHISLAALTLMNINQNLVLDMFSIAVLLHAYLILDSFSQLSFCFFPDNTKN